MMVTYKNSLTAILSSVFLSFVLQGCFADKQNDVAFEKAEEKRLEKEKFHEKNEQDLPLKTELAKTRGYKGYVEYDSIDKFTSAYEYGHIKIDDYYNYVIANKKGGTYAYRFTRVLDGIEIYQPDKKYGWVLPVGIKRSKHQNNRLLRGAPLLNTKMVRFLGVRDYKTIYGVYQRILLFERVERFKSISN